MTKIEEYLNSLPYHFYFLVVDDFLDISLPTLTNFTSVSPSSLGINLSQKNSGKLLSHPACIEFIKRHTPSKLTPAIIPFKPSSKIDLICKQQGWLNISNSGKLNRTLEDKLLFSSLLDQHQLPQLPHQITTLTQDNFLSAQKVFNTSKLVIQTHFGWAGNSSYMTDNYQQISDKVPEHTPVKIMPYLQGISLINNCCLTPNGLIQSPPGLQYTGIPLLSSNPLATTGRQWPSHASPEVLSQIRQLTISFSKILEQLGYKGFFGLDFFVYNQEVYILECNPRLTASFAFYTYIEQQAKYQPLFFHHLLSFIDAKFKFDIVQESSRFNSTSIIGSELTLKNTQGTTVRKYNDFVDMASDGNPTNISRQYLDKVLNEIQ
jgi:hypothetical protein